MKRVGILGTTILFAIFGFAVRMQAQDQHDKDAAPEKQEEAKPAEHQDDKAPKPEKQDAKPQEQPKPEKQDAKPQEQRQDNDKAAKQDEHQQDQQGKPAEKATKDQQKAAKDQQKQAEKQQKDQQKQTEQQQKAAQHDQQNNKDQKRDDQRVNGQQQPAQQANRPSPQPQHGNAGVQQSAWQEHRATNFQSEHRDWQQRGGYHGYRIPDDRFRASFGEAHRFRIDSVPVTVVEGFPRFQIDGFWFALVDPWPESWSNNWYDADDVYIEFYDGGYYLNDPRYPGVRLAINVYAS
jgi:hypothetical protein